MSGYTHNYPNQIELEKELTSAISCNLKKLLTDNNTTQKELAEKLGVSPASLTDYCKGRRMPGVDFFVRLKNLYGISIDDFLTKHHAQSSPVLSSQPLSLDDTLLTTYHKYCGIYYAYYFDTSKYKGRNDQSPSDSLRYGVILIYENQTHLGIPKFHCAAVLGIKFRDAIDDIKNALESFSDPWHMVDYIENNCPETAYYGDFTLSQEHAFLYMAHDSTDKALLILHRVDNNKKNYIGGMGTINSVSKGRKREPVVQFIGLSRYALTMSTEEIHHNLLLNYPSFKAESEAEEMIKNFSALYEAKEGESQSFSDFQKLVMVRSALERYIKKSLERNMFRYGKISEIDDDEWYHLMKVSTSDQE